MNATMPSITSSTKTVSASANIPVGSSQDTINQAVGTLAATPMTAGATTQQQPVVQ